MTLLYRLVDRGAVFAAMVGIGMALVIAISFLLVIPIEPVYWVLSLPAGLLIGYYADARSDRRRGEWRRVLANGLFAGLVTAISLVVLLLAVKALFFFADTGYRSGAPALDCDPGPPCVYARYLADGRGDDLVDVGVVDVNSFTRFYWEQQFATSGTLLVVGLVGSLFGAAIFGAWGPRSGAPEGERALA